MIEVRFNVLRKSQVDKIYPIVDFCHAGGGSEKVVFLPWVRLLLCVWEWKKGERWSGAHEILAQCRCLGKKLGSHSTNRRAYLSLGVTYAYAITLFHRVPWLLSVSLLSVACSSLGAFLGEWRGTSACARHVQFYQTLRTPLTQHEEEEVKQR